MHLDIIKKRLFLVNSSLPGLGYSNLKNSPLVNLDRKTKSGNFMVLDTNGVSYSLHKKFLIPAINKVEIPTTSLKNFLKTPRSPFTIHVIDDYFDSVMLWYGFFKENDSELGNRVLTSKAVKLGFGNIMSVLLANPNKQSPKQYDKSVDELKLLFELADKYGYELNDKNAWMDD